MPNPQRGAKLSLAVELLSDADFLEAGLYTKSMMQISAQTLPGAWRAGWNLATVALAEEPASGLYYVVVRGKNSEGEEAGPVAKVFFLQ